jgi:hypothetical protein
MEIFQKYNILKDMVRELNLDDGHWVNNEAIRFLKKKTYDRVDEDLIHIPEELLSKKLKCECGNEFIPKWEKKIKPYVVFYKKEKGILRMKSCGTECPKCLKNTFLDIPMKSYKKDLDVFGDEAFKTDIDNKSIVSYSFVSFSGSNKKKEHFISEFLKLKGSLVDSINPNDWILHMTELMNCRKRQETEYLSSLKKENINKTINEILDLISTSVIKGDLNLYCAIGVVEKKDFQSDKDIKIACKKIQFNAAFMQIIRESTANNLAPKFYFEKSGKDGWAEKISDSTRCTLIWPYITHGVPVMSPKFVKPAYSIFLEVADLLAYAISRYLYCLGKTVEGNALEAEFFPSQFGKIRYILTLPDKLIVETSKDFPLKKMFNGTSWDINFKTSRD